MSVLKKPLGSHDSPARSCQDLLLEDEEIESGRCRRKSSDYFDGLYNFLLDNIGILLFSCCC